MRQKHPRRLNAKAVLITQKDAEFAFLVADGSAKLTGRDYEFQEPTLRRESSVRRENLSGESHGDWEEFQPEETEDDEGINKDFWAHAEAREEFDLLSSYWTVKFNYVPREESFLISRDLNYWTKLLREEIYDAGRRMERSQNIWGRNKFNCIWYCMERTEFCTLLQLYERLRSNQKISRKLFTQFIWRWDQAHVVSSRGTAHQRDKILQVNLKIQGVHDTFKWQLGKKEVWTPKVVLFSELRKSRATYGSEDSGDLSLRDACLGKPRSIDQRSFIPSIVGPRCKGDNRKGMKGGHEEST